MNEIRIFTNRFHDRIALQPDIARGFRQMVALGVPLLLCHWLGDTADAPFVAMAAQTVALHDLRGAYRMRLAILATLTLVTAASGFLGVISGGNVVAAALATGLIALLGVCWRYLSADYGPGLSISSALLFLMALSMPGEVGAGFHMFVLVCAGGVGSTFLHAAFWLFRPQHPLRYAVAETWVAASDLALSMRAEAVAGGTPRNVAISRNEQEVRATLDRTFAIISAAEATQPPSFIAHLERMRREVVHLVMRIIAFHVSLDSLITEPVFARHLPAVDALLRALGNMARSVAITLITHRAENFALTEVRLRRCRDLTRVLDDRLASESDTTLAIAPMRAALAQIEQVLPRICVCLGETIAEARVRFNFAPSLPELSSRSLRSIAAWINPAPHLDPVLIRYGARIAVLTMFAAALYKGFDIPRGYWIALTIIVVLQPDFGSTRRRAAERIGGTIAGSLAASGLLWVKMPLALLDMFAALTCFGFGYFLKRNYGFAVFFVTLMVVLITETTHTVHLDFTASRLLSTLLGGSMALVAALVFWPATERTKFPGLLAKAIRANSAFLKSMASWSRGIRTPDGHLLDTKRHAENANRFAAASLQRMLSEPGIEKERGERASSLTAYNQRLTWALTGIAVHLQDAETLGNPTLAALVSQLSAVLESLAVIIARDADASDALEIEAGLAAAEASLDESASVDKPPGLTPVTEVIRTQLARAVTEIRAMMLEL